VFSRIYKYLQFKSTTGETFQRHINIDNGYKYLTTNTLKTSDHNLEYYYDPTDENPIDEGKNPIKPYLRYLSAIDHYINKPPSEDFFTPQERDVLFDFYQVLKRNTLFWLEDKWDLCPLLHRVSENVGELSPRKLMSRSHKRETSESEYDESYSDVTSTSESSN
jgi:hypothetical protein